MSRTVWHSAKRIAELAWPVFIGQLAVLGFATVDTVLVAHHSALDLAALAVGAAAYVTVFIGLMGVVQAVSPIVGRLYGAGRITEAGAQLQQAVWLALALAVLGCALLLFPEPFLAIARPAAEVERKVRGYLGVLSFALPASLLFTAYRGFSIAVSRPKAVMALQLGGFALKVPLSWALVTGAVPGLPAQGVVGCAYATVAVMWLQVAAAAAWLRRDRYFAPFALWQAWPGPRRAPLAAQLKLGVPMGLTILIEVTGFSFMAIFISRLGSTAVAGHQIAANLTAMLYMLPLGLANGAATLVAQRIGAGDRSDACRLGWHGVQIAAALALLSAALLYTLRGAIVRLYTPDPVIVDAALPLLAWVAVFHLGDALQCVLSFVLRAWHVATVPAVIYALSLWGVGLGGGYALAFGAAGVPSLANAQGFWVASAASLVLAAAALGVLLAVVTGPRREA